MLRSINHIGRGVQAFERAAGGGDVDDPAVTDQQIHAPATVRSITRENDTVRNDQEVLFQVVPVFLSSRLMPISASRSRMRSEMLHSF